MKRREFISLLGGAAAAWPLSARAQHAERARLIGALMNGNQDDFELGNALPPSKRVLQNKVGESVGTSELSIDGA